MFCTSSIRLLITTSLGIIAAGLLMSGENVVREIEGEFARNTPHFHGHYFVNSHFNQLTRDNYRWVFL